VDIMSAQGLSDYEVARRSGVPRSTVQRWRRGNRIARDQRDAAGEPDWIPLDPGAYSYLLGAYLGDGHITVVSQRSASLVITLDSSYPRIVAKVQQAVAAVFPGVRVHHYLRNGGSVTAVQANHPALPFAFPQHGPGRKHNRRIVLTEWQRALTHAYPKELLRGLIHSDGCRTVNRFKTKLPSGRVAEYEYPRYFFSNLSDDIRAIFCEHCELLGIRWTQSNPRNISVSHRKSVALLDEFIGPKA
jgi:Homeodomain-like domain